MQTNETLGRRDAQGAGVRKADDERLRTMAGVDQILDVGESTTADRGYYSSSAIAALRLSFKMMQASPRLATTVATKMFFRPRRKPSRAVDLPNLKQSTALIRHRRIKLYEAGQGAPVLLVHGWESSLSRVQLLAQQIVSAGYRLVALDLPAHGESEGSDTDPIEVSEVLAHLSRQYGHFHAAFGHSFGAVCLTHGMRQGLDVGRTILFASPSSVWTIIDTYSGFLHLNEPVRGLVRDRITQRFLPFTVDEHLDVVKNLRNTATPTLVVHDLGDLTVPFTEANKLKSAHADVHLVATTGSGHNRIMRNQSVIRECLDFLNTEPQGGSATVHR